MKKWKSWNCHDCGVKEGQIHKEGCDMERCPECGGQLITCKCFRKYDYNYAKLPFRIPYILIPNLCGLCGEQWSEHFAVSDDEWDKYVIPSLQPGVLCLECYNELKLLFPDGWKAVRTFLQNQNSHLSNRE